MLGLTFDKLLIIGVIAIFLIGPERLPHYAAQFARLVRGARDMANGAKERVRDEMGPEYDEIDWKKLDPRQYDPRRIIREALLDESPAMPQTVGHAPHSMNSPEPRRQSVQHGAARATPYDTEST